MYEEIFKESEEIMGHYDSCYEAEYKVELDEKIKKFRKQINVNKISVNDIELLEFVLNNRVKITNSIELIKIFIKKLQITV